MRATIAAILACSFLGVAACSERPPRPDPEGPRAVNNATPQHPMYERTLEQGEHERMGI